MYSFVDVPVHVVDKDYVLVFNCYIFASILKFCDLDNII